MSDRYQGDNLATKAGCTLVVIGMTMVLGSCYWLGHTDNMGVLAAPLIAFMVVLAGFVVMAAGSFKS